MSDPQNKRRFKLFRRKKTSESENILPQPPDDPSQWLESLPDTDSQALEQLAQVSEEEVRPLVITPQEERFPPLNPSESPAKTQAPAPSTSPKTKTAAPNNRRKNIITGLALIGTLFLCTWYSIIWIDPQTVFNPLPPFTPFMVVTATPIGGVIPQADVPPTAPTEAPAVQIPDVDFPFVLAPTGVIYAPNENGQGCEWQSIAGSINGLDGAPLSGYSVRIRGGNGLDERVFSGVTQTFGEGGYELFISAVPQAADYTVQLLTAQGAPLSNEVTISTRADCEGNVAIVNFVQISDF